MKSIRLSLRKSINALLVVVSGMLIFACGDSAQSPAKPGKSSIKNSSSTDASDAKKKMQAVASIDGWEITRDDLNWFAKSTQDSNLGKSMYGI